ncbi:alpha amylase C-terminal domain-containing protein [Blastococcus brunescens]|uniref:Alpha amylase C-terminal domain-containing protein n=1 Tax=Blastococcus brunescens TaxID=1564165 RepID=A0ABZ1B8M0_9ACTN|nr:alpha amylase C-terminal domain-containing protein [Blastococcus sp. BMG 8361]WRL67106.1 alpha amylase C-terminal domain-containing protein [Blastococcus sp. BMG 8361]
MLNTDAEGYGGSGVGNLGGVEAEPEPWHGQPYSATVAAPRSAPSGWSTKAEPLRGLRRAGDPR